MPSFLPSDDRHDSAASPSGAARPRVELEILRGRTRQKRRPVGVPTFLIGSANDCDLVLGDPQFSEVHAYLMLTDEGVSVRQLGFVPELTVNGVVVKRAILADGDRIRTGPYEFQVHIDAVAREVEQPATQVWPMPLDRVEDEVGVGEVRLLLRDIYDALFPVAPRLRVYIDPDSSLDGAERPAAWMRRRLPPDRQVGQI